MKYSHHLKLILFILFACPVVITGCHKDESENPQPVPPTGGGGGGGGGGSGVIGTPPSTFSSKVLLEYHTAAWCGTCVDAEVKRDQVMTAYTGKIVPVSIHQSDGMQKPYFFTIDATFGSNTAMGMVNRTVSTSSVLLNRTQWLSNSTVALGKTASCGLAMNSKMEGGFAKLEVQAAFNQTLSGAHNITVLLIEKVKTGSGPNYDQVNSYNNDPSSPLYGLGNPIVGYEHKYVVDRAITAELGDPISQNLLVPGGVYVANYTVDMTRFVQSNVRFVAFISKTGTTSTNRNVINVQAADLGTLQDWD
jgi:hypothetical protein